METAVRYCKCGVQIPAARLKILPNTHTCVNCSDIKTKKFTLDPTPGSGYIYTDYYYEKLSKNIKNRFYFIYRFSEYRMKYVFS
jgi:hypothetical protein